MLFMGQEFAASAPFLFFADFPPGELARQIREGRKGFLAQFPSYGSPDAQAAIADPCIPPSFSAPNSIGRNVNGTASVIGCTRICFGSVAKIRSSRSKRGIG